MAKSISLVPRPRRPDGLLATQHAEHLVAMAIQEEAIAKRAYDKFVARGSVHGFDQEDWTQANRELMAEAIGNRSFGAGD